MAFGNFHTDNIQSLQKLCMPDMSQNVIRMHLVSFYVEHDKASTIKTFLSRSYTACLTALSNYKNKVLKYQDNSASALCKIYTLSLLLGKNYVLN